MTRRLALLGCAGAAVGVACAGEEAPDPVATPTGPGTTTTGATTSSTSGVGGGGMGGMGAGGGAEVCGTALVVQGSNYATDPHDLTIPIEDLMGSGPRTYETTGIGHTHDVEITEAEFEALRNGETVRKYVCYDDVTFTDHEWVISCADPTVAPTFEGEIGTPGNCPA